MRLLKSKAMFMIFLVLTLPFFISSVFAEPYETKTKEVSTPLLQGPGMDPGQACANKVTQIEAEISDEEEGIRVIEGIVQTFGAICTTVSGVFFLIDTIRLAWSEATNIISWDCAKPTFLIDPSQPGFLNTLFTVCSLATSGVVCGGANELTKSGYLPQYVAPECDYVTKQTTSVLGNALTVGIDPYASIYEAAICLSPAGMLYNFRKKRMIDQAYSCCMAQSCVYGFSPESCEEYRSYAMCMYEEGAIKKALIRTLAGAVAGVISEFIACAFISQGIKPYCLYLIFNIAAIPGMIKGMIQSIQFAVDTFETPTCEDLGFGDIKDEVTAEDPRTPWHMNDLNVDGKYDKIWSKYDEVSVDEKSIPADLKQRLDLNKQVNDPTGATYTLRAGYNTETGKAMKTYNVNFKSGKTVEYYIDNNQWQPQSKGQEIWDKNYVSISDTVDLPSDKRPDGNPVDDQGNKYFHTGDTLVEVPSDKAEYMSEKQIRTAIKYGWREPSQGDIMEFTDQQGNTVHMQIPAGEPDSYMIRINEGKPNEKEIRYNSESDTIQVQQAVPEKATQTIKYEAGMDDLFAGGDNINWDETSGDKIVLKDGKTITKDLSKGYVVKNRWGNEIEYRKYEPVKDTADGRVIEVVKSIPNNGPKTVFKTIIPKDGNDIEVSYGFDNPSFLEPNAIVVKRVDKDTGVVLAEAKISEDSIRSSDTELLAASLDNPATSELTVRGIEEAGSDFAFKAAKPENIVGQFTSKDGLVIVSVNKLSNTMRKFKLFDAKDNYHGIAQTFDKSGSLQKINYITEKGVFTILEFDSKGAPVITNIYNGNTLYPDGSYLTTNGYYYDRTTDTWWESKGQYDVAADLEKQLAEATDPSEIQTLEGMLEDQELGSIITEERLDADPDLAADTRVEKAEFENDVEAKLPNGKTIKEDAKDKKKANDEKLEAEKNKKQEAETLAEPEGLTAYERVMWKNLIFQAVWTITGFILDKVYEDVDESCREEYQSSQPESSTPWTGDSSGGSGGEGGPGGDSGTGGACESSNSTILTAQLYRIGNNTPYDYDYSFTITACKEAIDFTVTLEDGAVLNLAQGSVSFENVSAGTDVFTSSTAYDEICVNVTDTDVGKACFPYAVP